MKRNKFSLSHYKLLTMNFGELIPLTWYSVIPGDTVQQRTNLLVRLSPLLAPIMHPVVVRIHHWFVPLRLIWTNWEDFITGGEDGASSAAYPYKAKSGVLEGTLEDYLGLPVSGAYGATINVSALPLRAYNLIWNENYRDQQLSTAVTVNKGDGSDGSTPDNILKVCWEKDYFTAGRPYEQLGTEITIPLSGTAPVTGIGVADANAASGSVSVRETGESSPSTFTDGWSTSAQAHMIEEEGTTNYPNIYAQLSEATGLTINDLRLYYAMQRYQEARNDYGARYVEYLQHAFGVRSSDARLQNPEYLGGGRQIISFSEIIGTGGADDGSNSPIGAMRGHGLSAMRTNRYRRFFEEHGLVMTLMSVVPKAIYADGVHREFYKTTKEDYYQKELAHIGDQAILNQEVYADHTTPSGTFGYQQRYDEYRSHPSSISGEFVSSLNHWHYARQFGSDPSLNEAFVLCDPTKRQYADNSSDVLYVMANHSIQARRPIPKYPRKKLM